jgi:2-polyprenyl-6-methoxyphenol hydroxylase-like FAD-dependent oxidoreductase
VLFQVIIVGAGPSGLLLGILLSKQGIQVDLLEQTATLDDQPRAAHYASPAAYELDRAGVLDDVKARGFHPHGVAWRKIDGTFIAGARNTALPRDYRYAMVCLPLDRLGLLLYEHIQRYYPTATVRWAHRVVKLGQDDEKAWVEVQTPGEEEDSQMQRFEADYVIGCDGASSAVRRELFGPEYPGETLNAQIIATNVYIIPISFFFFFFFI